MTQLWKESQILLGALVCVVPKTSSQGAFITWAFVTFSQGCLASLESRLPYNLNQFAPTVVMASFASLTFAVPSLHAVLAAVRGDDVALMSGSRLC